MLTRKRDIIMHILYLFETDCPGELPLREFRGSMCFSAAVCSLPRQNASTRVPAACGGKLQLHVYG